MRVMLAIEGHLRYNNNAKLSQSIEFMEINHLSWMRR